MTLVVVTTYVSVVNSLKPLELRACPLLWPDPGLLCVPMVLMSFSRSTMEPGKPSSSLSSGWGTGIFRFLTLSANDCFVFWDLFMVVVTTLLCCATEPVLAKFGCFSCSSAYFPPATPLDLARDFYCDMGWTGSSIWTVSSLDEAASSLGVSSSLPGCTAYSVVGTA